MVYAVMMSQPLARVIDENSAIIPVLETCTLDPVSVYGAIYTHIFKRSNFQQLLNCPVRRNSC